MLHRGGANELPRVHVMGVHCSFYITTYSSSYLYYLLSVSCIHENLMRQNKYCYPVPVYCVDFLFGCTLVHLTVDKFNIIR